MNNECGRGRGRGAVCNCKVPKEQTDLWSRPSGAVWCRNAPVTCRGSWTTLGGFFWRDKSCKDFIRCVYLVKRKNSFCFFLDKSKQENRTLQRPIFTIFTGLLHSHLPHTINHRKHLSSSMQLYNRMTAQVLAFPLSWDHAWTSSSFTLQLKCRIYSCLESYQVWNKTVHKCHNTGQW